MLLEVDTLETLVFGVDLVDSSLVGLPVGNLGMFGCSTEHLYFGTYQSLGLGKSLVVVQMLVVVADSLVEHSDLDLDLPSYFVHSVAGVGWSGFYDSVTMMLVAGVFLTLGLVVPMWCRGFFVYLPSENLHWHYSESH